MKGVPRWILLATLIAVSVSWIPLALIARDRTSTSTSPRMSLIPDMDSQQKFKAQSKNTLFADGRAARRPVEGTVARGNLRLDKAFHTGNVDGEWILAIPIRIDDRMMARGQERFNIYCAPCHGLDGAGNGPVAHRADALQEGTWVPPTSMHTDVVRQRPAGHLFNSITNGIRNMPSYGGQIEEADRWAIVAYIRALQRSQNARVDDVPTEYQQTLR